MHSHPYAGDYESVAFAAQWVVNLSTAMMNYVDLAPIYECTSFDVAD